MSVMFIMFRIDRFATMTTTTHTVISYHSRVKMKKKNTEMNSFPRVVSDHTYSCVNCVMYIVYKIHIRQNSV